MELILRTKLFVPPLRPNLVQRSRLIEKLDEGLRYGRSLSLVSAAAGFGKTTLVSAWTAGSEHQIAWLSLDEGDSDLTRFLSYLIAALQTVEPDIGSGVLAVLQTAQREPDESILTWLLNDISSLVDRIVLILDDYHIVDAPAVDQALAYLLENLPPQLHLVIVTREDPYLPLARLRARGQMTEIRASALRFSEEEAADFLNNIMGLNLAVEEITALERRTEGWIAGLQMAAVSIQGREDTESHIQSFTGSHRFVLDYLIEEVLDQQPEGVQRFLLQTAVLKKLSGSLCDALMDQSNGQETLEMLDRSNLFIIPLDNERQWYRYYHLFADLLRKRQRQNYPDQIPLMHGRASEWYEQNGYVEEAVNHALLAEEYERATRQIGLAADLYWARGTERKLQKWIKALPEAVLYSNPHLCIYHAWNQMADGDQNGAQWTLQAAERALEMDSNWTVETRPTDDAQLIVLPTNSLRGRIAATRAFLAFYRGDSASIAQYAEEALKCLPEDDLAWRSTAAHILGDAYDFQGNMVEAKQRHLEAMEISKAAGNSYVMIIAGVKLAINLRYQGELLGAAEICEEQYQLAHRSGMDQTMVGGWLMATWGEILAELNDLDRALQYGQMGMKIVDRGGDLAMLGFSYLCLIRIFFTRNELDRADEIVRRLDDHARNSYVPPFFMNQNAAWKARIWLAQGKLGKVSLWVTGRGLDAQNGIAYLHEMELLVLARLLAAEGRPDEALDLQQQLLDAAENGGRISRMVQIRLLQAMTLHTTGEMEQAAFFLEQALALAEPRGFVRTFVDEGPLAARLLQEANSSGLMPDYTSRLLQAFVEVKKGVEADSHQPRLPDSPPLVDPLSARELEVLRLVAQGLSNREICERLFLALNTVKGHNRNIFGKLGVHRRTEAVARARELGLL